ncbi:MAG: polysaccharide biosynthesis/export family protein [Bacteroidales bacterium]|nr:polysaccharide biosynthesis/export family protein [Bacteroidales bacterium]
MKYRFRLNVILLLIIALSSCVPVKKLTYVRTDLPNSHINSYINEKAVKTIQPYDYLYIQIYSLDERTNNIFNNNRNTTYDTQLLSYMVDDQGYISFPFVGKIFVQNMTISQAKDKLEESLSKYLNNISVRLRFVGNSVTILGDVNNPGTHSFYDEKLNVFQALSLASGIANFGDKTNVTMIREIDNKITYHYLDLTNKNIVTSEYYYLLPNDILIVEPTKSKYRSLRDYSGIYLIMSAISSLAVIINITK